METITTALQSIPQQDYFYPIAVIIFTWITLQLCFKVTPKWFKIVITLAWGTIFGVIWFYSAKMPIHLIVVYFGFAMAFYDRILAKILTWVGINYNNGKGLL